MKKICLSLIVALLSGTFVYAQSNTFPTPTGNVGIGNASPVEALSVTSSSASTISVLRSVIGNLTFLAAAGKINFGAFNTTTNAEVYSPSIFGQATEAWGTTAQGSSLAFWTVPNGTTTAAPAMRIDQTGGVAIGSYASSIVTYTPAPTGGLMVSGNVLIGQSSQVNPAYILDVNGSARAKAIIVNTTGADFVFGPSYKLPSLSGLEKYIMYYHHLPEIGSAKQMQAEGLNVGENQTKLLQKVEELTLYLIKKDKEIKDQSAQLKSQQDQINLLIKQVAELSKKK